MQASMQDELIINPVDLSILSFLTPALQILPSAPSNLRYIHTPLTPAFSAHLGAKHLRRLCAEERRRRRRGRGRRYTGCGTVVYGSARRGCHRGLAPQRSQQHSADVHVACLRLEGDEG